MTAAPLVLTNAAIAGRAAASTVTIEHGRILHVEDTATRPHRGTEIDLHGRVLAPAFSEPHIHLDKALLGTPSSVGSLADAIAETARRKRAFTVDDVLGRARRVLRQGIEHGTTRFRAHTEVDPTVGLTGVEAIGALADEYEGIATVQLAVLPQEGIFARPGTLTLMRAALARAGTVVGGCPYTEATVTDARRHVDTVLDLALEFDVPADLHLDFADDRGDERFALAAYVATATAERGLHGRVSVGHVTSLDALAPADLGPVADALASADVAVVMLPATDLHLMGRRDSSGVRRGLAPLRALRAAGVRVAASSNNVRNAFTPTGTADMLDIALLLARTTHAASDADFADVLDMATVAGARIIDDADAAEPSGIVPGARADLVVLDSTEPTGVLIDQPDVTLVITGGRPVFSQHRTAQWLVGVPDGAGEHVAIGGVR